MAVKLARYIFVRVRGRIVPIRKGLQRATKSQNKLADKINKFKDADKEFRELKKIMPKRSFPKQQKMAKLLQDRITKRGLKKVGSGVDFDVFKRKSSNDFVIKMEKVYGGRKTKGTSATKFNKRFKELSDKIAVTKTLSDNLPNYGIPTLETEIIRLKKGRRGILQKFVKEKRSSSDFLRREGKRIKDDHGLDLDIHRGNVINDTLIDTGGNLAKSKITEIDDAAKELLGIDSYYGTNIKDVYKKSTIMSDEAIIQGQSKGALRRINAMIKKGYRFKRSGKNEYDLVPKKLKKLRKK